MKTATIVVAVSVICGLASVPNASAQMRAFEQNVIKLRARLVPRLYDGKTLKVTTWAELVQVRNFVTTFGAALKKTIAAWNALRMGKTQARRNKIVTAQAYYKGLYAQYVAKSRVIKPPAKVVKKKIVPLTLEAALRGPDIRSEKPSLIHFWGDKETWVQVWGTPGNDRHPSHWFIRTGFAVKLKGITSSSHVEGVVYKGRRKLKLPPLICKPQLMTGWPAATFKCDNRTRDDKKLATGGGWHTLKLTYKDLVLGKTFKNFATIKFNVLRLWGGSVSHPAVMWRTNHDVHMGPTTIELRRDVTYSAGRASPRKSFMKGASSATAQASSAYVVLRTWVKRPKYMPTQATCLYKGKVVSWGARSNGSGMNWTVGGRAKKRAKKSTTYRWEQLRFDFYGIQTVGLDGRRGGSSKPPHWLDKNPGDYKCVIIGGGKVIKEVFFTVKDGKIVKPSCQDKILNTFHNMTLVKAKTKTKGMKWNNGKIAFGGAVSWKRACP